MIKKDKDDPCWRGYASLGMKKKGGRMVPNCVPIDTKHEEASPTDRMAIGNSLQKQPVAGGKDRKNPQLSETMRMPRMEVVSRDANRNGTLAMRASANRSSESFCEDGGPLQSGEPNGRMAINQLRAMRENIDMILGVLYPDDNLEPWIATKLATSSQNLTSISDYIRYGYEA